MEDTLKETLRTIFQPFKGILAADERPSSLNKRFKKYGIEPNEDTRSEYRRLLFTTPKIERTISGVILSEDTFLNHTIDSILTREWLQGKGIVVGVKVDQGLEQWNDTQDLKITAGLDGLDERCQRYQIMGASFTKWRATIPVGLENKDFMCDVVANLSEYARISLDNGLIPIIEPEVLLSGNHTPAQVAHTLKEVLKLVLDSLRKKECPAQRCILKTSFAAGGLAGKRYSADEVGRETLRAFIDSGLDKRNSFYGIVFLSGGLDSATAIEYIQTIKAMAEKREDDIYFKKPITFSYGRALQLPAMKVWNGDEANTTQAQLIFTQTLQNAVKVYKGAETSVGEMVNPARGQE